MFPRQDRFIYVAGASLVAIARSVEAKSKSSQKTSKPASTSGGGGSTCYDDNGNQITCPLSKTEYIVIGVIGGIVFLVVLVSVIGCVVRKRRQGLASKPKPKMKDTKGAHEKVPTASEEDTLPLYHNQANPFDSGEMAEGEKPHYSTPYDPPTQHYDHQFSDSASIASSVYNAPPVTAAQPQDYSNQYYYNPDITAPPRMYAPPPHHPSTDV